MDKYYSPTESDLNMFMWNSIWCRLVHEFLEVKVQILEDKEEFSITVQHFNKTEGRRKTRSVINMLQL